MENTATTKSELKDRAVGSLGNERVNQLLSSGILAITLEMGKAHQSFRDEEADALRSLHLYFTLGGR